MTAPQDTPENEVITYRTCQECFTTHWHRSHCPGCGKNNPPLAQPDDTTKPAPLSDEEVEFVLRGLENPVQLEWAHPDMPEEGKRDMLRLLATVRDMKRRAEEAEVRARNFLGDAHRVGAVAEERGNQLSDIRIRLGGSPDSKLDGDDGLVERFVTRYDDMAFSLRDLAHLREENERLRGDRNDLQDELEVTIARVAQLEAEKAEALRLVREYGLRGQEHRAGSSDYEAFMREVNDALAAQGEG